METLIRKSLLRDLPPDAVVAEPFDGLLEPENKITGGWPAVLTTVFGQEWAYRFWLPATEPWVMLHYPDGSPMIGRGIRIRVMDLDWTSAMGVPPITTLCPRGTEPAGKGWTFRFCPPYSVSVAINNVQCSAPNPDHNPRDIFSRVGPGPVAIGLNDRAQTYVDNAGGCHVLVLAVYR